MPLSRTKTHRPSFHRYLKSLFFGFPGAGKTTFIGTAADDPRTSPLLILNFEGGESSLAGRDVEIADITDWKTYHSVLEELKGTGHGFKAVAIDSITETHIFSLFEILEQEEANRKNPDLVEIGDYGIASIQLRRLIRNFRDLELHVLLTALAKQDVEPGVGSVIKPALSGKLADELPGIVDVVGYIAEVELEDKSSARALILKNYPKIRAKIRVPKEMLKDVPDEIIDPTVTLLMDALNYQEE